MSWMKRIVVVAPIVCILCTGCRKDVTPGEVQTKKPIVYTTFYPAKYFAERIGGDLIEVVCPVPPDKDAIFWMPDAATIQAYQAADLIILNGAGFAKWVQKVSLPESKVVDTSKPLKGDLITFEDVTVHSHGSTGEHAHEGLDGHTWVDPVNAKVQADEIMKALTRRFPEHEAPFKKGLTALAEDLNALDGKLKAYQASYRNQPMLASHPAYNYIARRYGWNIKNLDLDPEEMPSREAFQTISKILEKHPAKHLIWETSPVEAIANRLREELGIISIEFSPCELLPKEDQVAGMDYLGVMSSNIENMRVIFNETETASGVGEKHESTH